MIHEHFSAAFSYTGNTPEITAALRAMKQVLFTDQLRNQFSTAICPQHWKKAAFKELERQLD